MATWIPDPTFYPSPRLATQAPPEKLAYVASLDPTRLVIALSAIGASAAAKLTDPQIAHIVYTANNLDIENAKQALPIARQLSSWAQKSPQLVSC